MKYLKYFNIINIHGVLTACCWELCLSSHPIPSSEAHEYFQKRSSFSNIPKQRIVLLACEHFVTLRLTATTD